MPVLALNWDKGEFFIKDRELSILLQCSYIAQHTGESDATEYRDLLKSARLRLNLSEDDLKRYSRWNSQDLLSMEITERSLQIAEKYRKNYPNTYAGFKKVARSQLEARLVQALHEYQSSRPYSR